MSDGRNPDAIQREIEATRAELAATIDAIADRVSPKKAASRSREAVKAKANAALGHVEKAAADMPAVAAKAVAPVKQAVAAALPVTANPAPTEAAPVDAAPTEPAPTEPAPVIVEAAAVETSNASPITKTAAIEPAPAAKPATAAKPAANPTPRAKAESQAKAAPPVAEHKAVATVQQRSLRTDRVMFTVGATAAAAAVVVLIRGRKR